MCYSKAEGGARCSTHARSALDKATEAYAAFRAEHPGRSDDPEAQKEAQRLRDEVAARRFDYQTTPQGQRELSESIALQQARVAEVRAKYPATGPGSTGWLSSDEQRTLSAMESTRRSAQKVREAQDAARKRHQEVQSGQVGEQTAQALAAEQDKPVENVAVQDYNGSWHRSQVIGVVAVDESFSHTDASGEVAAWSTTHQVKPGIYPVSLTERGDLTWSYDTTITDEHHPALFGGVPIGGAPDPKPDVGKSGRLHQQAYAFAAPPAYTPGIEYGGGSLVLRKGVKVSYQSMSRTPDGSHEPSTSALTRFTVTDAVNTEPQRNPRFIEEEHSVAARRAAALGRGAV